MKFPKIQTPQEVYNNFYCLYIYILVQRLNQLYFSNSQVEYIYWWDGEKYIVMQWDGEKFVPIFENEERNENEDIPKDLSRKNDLDEIRKDEFIQPNRNDNEKHKEDKVSYKIIAKNYSSEQIQVTQETDTNSKNEEGKEGTDKPYKEYKSPIRKLLPFFEKSRDKWKTKCIDTRKQNKLLKKNNKNLKESNKRLKKRIECFKAEIEEKKINVVVLEEEIKKLKNNFSQEIQRLPELFNIIPDRHQYPVGIMHMYISLVLSASSSFRGAEKSLEIVIKTLNMPYSVPSWSCGRLWLLRLGLYKLTCEREKANDWIWIVDHIAQLGEKKCLAIYGIRLETLSSLSRPLRFEDIEPLAIIPVSKSNGDIVLKQLEQTVEKTGIPREIIGDQGSDIKSGIDRFCKNHTETSYIYDVKHKAAIVLKNEFKDNNVWKKFTELSNLTRQKIQQTALSFLMPKKQRTKARYMNIDDLIEWGVKLLCFVETQEKNPDKELNQEIINEKLGWVRDFDKNLKEWSKMIEVTETVIKFVRRHGVCNDSYPLLKKELPAFSGITECTKRICNEFLDFVKLEGLKAFFNEKLLGSSEIIESAFGKLKEIEKNQIKGGFTGLVLILAAMVSKTTEETIQKALEAIPTKKVRDWCEENINETMQSKRRKYFNGSGNAEQKQNQFIEENV